MKWIYISLFLKPDDIIMYFYIVDLKTLIISRKADIILIRNMDKILVNYLDIFKSIE